MTGSSKGTRWSSLPRATPRFIIFPGVQLYICIYGLQQLRHSYDAAGKLFEMTCLRDPRRPEREITEPSSWNIHGSFSDGQLFYFPAHARSRPPVIVGGTFFSVPFRIPRAECASTAAHPTDPVIRIFHGRQHPVAQAKLINRFFPLAQDNDLSLPIAYTLANILTIYR